MRHIILLLLIIAGTYGDTIITSSGKEIKGKIVSFSTLKGLVVETEYGNVTITPGNLTSFVIENNYTAEAKKDITLENSKLYADGYTIAQNNLKDLKITFETASLGRPNALVEIVDMNKATYGLIMKEQIGISNKEYADLVVQNVRSAVQYFIDGFERNEMINGIDMILREYSVKASGYEFTYLVGFFKSGDYNYSITTWTYKQAYENRKGDLMNIIKAVKKRKEYEK